MGQAEKRCRMDWSGLCEENISSGNRSIGVRASVDLLFCLYETDFV